MRELVFRAIRRSAERPASGRAAMLGLAQDEPELLALFGQVRGPAPIVDGEEAQRRRGVVPSWLEPQFRRWSSPANGRRCSSARRSTFGSMSRATDRDAMSAQFPGAEPTRISPWGLRLPPDTRVDDHPAFADGLVDVQDEGSQLIALACEPKDGMRILDLCAGAGGKALALAAAAPGAEILATDSNRSRLSKLAPRAAKARRENRDAPAQSPARARCAGRLGRDRRRRAGRCALLGQRHLAAQSRRVAGG